MKKGGRAYLHYNHQDTRSILYIERTKREDDGRASAMCLIRGLRIKSAENEDGLIGGLRIKSAENEQG